MNEQIRISPVRLIDAEGEQRGVISTDEALRLAGDSGMDLVEVSPHERPPVCKIMDYGRHRYLQSKKQKQKHHEQKLKEVRLRPKTDAHDRKIKLERARTFLEHGDRVQFTMLFRGRERFHKELGFDAFKSIATGLEEIAKIEREPRMLGRRMTMVLVPTKLVPPKKPTASGGKAAPETKQAGVSASAKSLPKATVPESPRPPVPEVARPADNAPAH